MTTRREHFLEAIDVLQSGRSLDVEGEHGSGRTHFLRSISDYFTALGWVAVSFAGQGAFARTPLVALSLGGVAEAQDGRPSAIAACVKAITESVVPGRSIIVVDDWDHLDEASAGVLRAVQERAGVPILSSRLIHRSRHDPVLPTGAFTTTYTMRLSGMGYGELETALEPLVGFGVEPGTLSRVFAKSGGNVGLAAAVVDAARRSGRLVVEDGVGRATGTLWSPALRLMVDVILQPLDPPAVEALEVLAILGPADVATAEKAVGLAMIADLEDRDFVTVADMGGSRVVSVRPPLLVEHFRSDALAGRRSEMLSRLDDLLSEGSPFDDENRATPRDSALFVRLVHERTRRRTLQARDAWQSAQTLATATALLSALEIDGAHGSDELEALIGAAHGLDGTEIERAEWEVARLAVQAVQGGDAAAAVDELRSRAAALPREGGLLLGRAAELETSFLGVPVEDPLAGVDTEQMSTRARSAVLRGRAFWQLARGSVEEAERVLAQLDDQDADPDPLADALAVFAHLLSDRFPLAARIADDGLAHAQQQFDAPLIRIYAFLSVLTALMDRRLDDAEHALSASSFLGLPSPFPPLSFVGLKTIAAVVAARRGQRALMEQMLADIDAAGLSDGPFIGQSAGLAYARIAEVEEGVGAAAQICFETGDALWNRGATLSAAYAYLEGMQYEPTTEHWERVEARVTSASAPTLIRETRLVRTLVDRDADALVRHILDLEAAGRRREALHCADLGARVFADAAHDEEAVARITALRSELRDDGVETMSPVVIHLTPREYEIAQLVASGLSNAVIAEALVLSVRTVESHVNRLLRKTGLRSRQDIKGFLVGYAPPA